VNVSSSKYVLLALLSLSLFVALQSNARPQRGEATPQRPAATKIDESAEGEKRFRTNCGRCHHPPEDLSPREARSVVRQMRVRAMLSAEDERLILKFLAP
jgi:mono/diheme cytochrome c family protein